MDRSRNVKRNICVNGPCKKTLKRCYLSWQLKEIQRRQANGETGKLVIKVSREQLTTWTEVFVEDFNNKERLGITNILIPCLTKLRQNIFADDEESFPRWLDSLNENALYMALLRAHTASIL